MRFDDTRMRMPQLDDVSVDMGYSGPASMANLLHARRAERALDRVAPLRNAPPMAQSRLLTSLVVLIRLGYLGEARNAEVILSQLAPEPRSLLMAILQARDVEDAVKVLEALTDAG